METLNKYRQTDLSNKSSESVMNFTRVDILGVPFSLLSFENAVDATMAYISSRTSHQICLSNAYTVAIAQKDEEFMRVMHTADMVLADGMSIVWGGRWIGKYLPHRVAGPDFMGAVCEAAAKKGRSIYLLGSSEENLKSLQSVLKTRYPNLRILGTYSPPVCDCLDTTQNAIIKDHLLRAKPDVLFVGLSAPKQEKWIAKHLQELNIPVCIGVGAAFDFISGRIPRAPYRMQKRGLEWLYRLYCEPRRLWKRYLLGNSVFLSLLLRKLILSKLGLG